MLGALTLGFGRNRRIRALANEEAVSALGIGVAVEEREGRLRMVNECALGMLIGGVDDRRAARRPTRMDQLAQGFVEPKAFLDWTRRRAAEAGVLSSPRRFRTRSGRTVEVHRRGHEWGGGTVGIWVFRDVTERRLTEVRLRAARDAAEAASRAKSEFLAVVSHEIRTPMNAILGMTDLALDTQMSRDQRGLLETVRTSAGALLAVINDILDVSKIESGTLSMRREPFSLVDLIESVVESVAPRAFEKGLELVSHVDSRIPDALDGDAHRLRQVLVNLLGNAVKFTEKGKVVLRSEVVAEADEQVRIRLSVRDTGIGISSEDLQHVFDPFFQAAGSLSRSHQGTGLGLGISRSLMELMGGTLRAESARGEGSTFIAEVPFGRSAAEFPKRRASDRTYPEFRAVVVSRDEDLRAAVVETLGFLDVPAVGSPGPAGVRDLLRFLPARHRVLLVVDHRVGLSEMEALGRFARDAASVRPLVMTVLVPPGSPDPWRIPGPADTHYLVKPVMRRGLAGALAESLGESTRSKPELAAPTETPGLHGLRVLLVEDHPSNQEYASRVLESAGLKVDVANDGLDGLARYGAAPYDVVLTDLEMPGIDGFELVERIRALETGSDRPRVPVIALTAHAVEGYAERCIAAGMDVYVTKPVSRTPLLQAIRDVVRVQPRVLIVDDEAANRELLRRTLSREGYRVEVVDGGVAALARVQEGGLDAVLLDMTLPDLDGYAVAARIRGLEHVAGLPVIAVTGHVGPEAEERCLAAGCSAFVEKPVRRARLMAVLSEWVSPGRGVPVAATDTDATCAGDANALQPRVPADIADLATRFLEDRRAELPQLHAHLEAHDFESLARAGHTIAGSSGCLGFDDLTARGRALHDAARQGDETRIASMIRSIEHYLDRVDFQIVAD